MKIDLDAIPAALKGVPHWIVWKYTDRDGKPDKPPIDHRTGLPGAVTDPTVWMTFGRAREALASGAYSGLGFAFAATDEFAGVDLDQCLDADGNIAPWAERVVDGLQSYTEVSPSGRGLHIWVRGQLPRGGGHKKGGLGADGRGAIEFYDRARYFTVTGRRWPGTPATVERRDEELLAFHREVFPPGEAPGPRATPAPHDLSDAAILARARAAWNGARFRLLYDRGDTAGYQGDESRADLALCSHLCFWAGGAGDVVDRLFRGSALYRPKWDERRGEQTYGERTIAKALEGMRSFYTPRGGAGAGGGGREPGDDGDGGEVGPSHRTDLGNARRLIALRGDDLRYCFPWGKWLAWAGDRWQVDEGGLVYRHARAVVAALHAEARAAEDEALRRAAIAWALACESEKRVNAMVSMARHEEGMPIYPAELDAPPWFLNCPNGTLDLRTGRLGPHVRGDLLTKRTAAPFAADAPCPAWEAFLARVMGDDPEMVAFLRRAVGYAMTGDVSEHALFFLHGRGRNGKSTFLNTILHALGDYAIAINADLLTARNQDEHPTGVADLQGRRFVATIEVEDGRRLAESLVKTLTGGDKIRARHMRQDFYEFEPTHKLFLAANHKPTVRGTDDGIWRRIKLIPFAIQIPTGEVDRALPDRLRAEAAGILAWAVRGCREWLDGGLCEPRTVVEATAEYREESDYLADFLAECCTEGPQQRSRSGALYRAYTDWCKRTGNNPVSMNKLGRLLTERGFAIEKRNSQNLRLGLGIKPQFLPDPYSLSPDRDDSDFRD